MPINQSLRAVVTRLRTDDYERSGSGLLTKQGARHRNKEREDIISRYLENHADMDIAICEATSTAKDEKNNGS